MAGRNDCPAPAAAATRRQLLLASLGLVAAPGRLEAGAGARFAHGFAGSDVTHHSAVLWIRASGAALLALEVAEDPAFPRIAFRTTARAAAEQDFTAHAAVAPLRADQVYYYRPGPIRGSGREHYRIPADRR